MDAFSTHPREIVELDQAMPESALGMGVDERDRVTAEGKMMSLDEVVSLARKQAP